MRKEKKQRKVYKLDPVALQRSLEEYSPIHMLLEDIYTYGVVPKHATARCYLDKVDGEDVIALVGTKENVEAIRDALLKGGCRLDGRILRPPSKELAEKILAHKIRDTFPALSGEVE